MITRYFKVTTITTALLAVMLFTGCAGYQVGSMLPPDINTVYVPTFVNDTTEPLIEIETTQAAINQIQQDGSLRVANLEDADAILEVELKRYTLDPVSFERNRETRANEYRILVEADVVLRRKATNEIIVQAQGVAGEADFIFSGDLSSAKTRAMPEAARDLAHDIVETVVEMW